MPADDSKRSRSQFRSADPQPERMKLKEAVCEVQAKDIQGYIDDSDTLGEESSQVASESKQNPDSESCTKTERIENSEDLLSLTRLLAQEDGPLRLERAIGIIIQACDNLSSRSSGHGKLSPDSLLLRIEEQDDIVLVADPDKAVSAQTYRAPELQQSAATDCCGDVYSLGAILYEMISNKNHSAAQNSSFASDLSRWLAHSPAWSSTPTKLKEIIRTCLHSNPALRYKSANELKTALNIFLQPAQAVIPSAIKAKHCGSLGKGLALLSIISVLFCAYVYTKPFVQNSSTAPVAPVKAVAPVALLSGNYAGNVSYYFRHGDKISTILTRTADGKLEGEYSITEDAGEFKGKLKQLNESNGEVTLGWTDKYGRGTLVIRSSNGSSFSGYWTHLSRVIGDWDGKLIQE